MQRQCAKAAFSRGWRPAAGLGVQRVDLREESLTLIFFRSPGEFSEPSKHRKPKAAKVRSAAGLAPPQSLWWRFRWPDISPALSENWIMLGGQGHEAMGQLEDFSRQPPRGGKRR